MVISDSNYDASQESLNESDVGIHGLALGLNTDFNLVIYALCIRPLGKPCISVPICHLVSLPLVRPILEVDVQLLENEFVNGYREDNKILYVSVVDDLWEILYRLVHMIDLSRH